MIFSRIHGYWATITIASILVVFQGMTGGVEAQTGAKSSVLVMLNDEGDATISRSNPIARDVIAAVQDRMSQGDFFVIDQRTLETKAGFEAQDRMPKRDLIGFALAARSLPDPSLRPRFLATISVRASLEKTSFEQIGRLRVSGDIHDVLSSRFVTDWRAAPSEFRTDTFCTQLCIENLYSDAARSSAAKVAKTLERTLSGLVDGPGSNARAGTAGGRHCSSLVTVFDIEFNSFSDKEVQKITNDMEKKFPCFVDVTSFDGSSTNKMYGYKSTAPADKIIKWITTLFYRMNLPPDDQVTITKSDGKILLEKLYD